MMDSIHQAALKRWGVGVPAAILEVLAADENYGSGIRDAVEAAAKITVGPGTLYPTLHAMEQAGLLASREDANGGGRPRRWYRLTQEGHAVAAMIREQVHTLYGGGE